MYATIKSIVSLVAEINPSAAPPMFFDMFKYGSGGCGLWGSLCGCCNGGAAVIGLFHQDKMIRDGLIDRLFRWYESSELPIFAPSSNEGKPFPKAAAQSVLCHMSVDRWCKAAGEKPFTAKQNERCRRLTADAAEKVVELLNDQYNEGAARKEPPASVFQTQSDASTQPPHSCIACHSVPGGPPESADKATPKLIVKMNCANCHETKANHPE